MDEAGGHCTEVRHEEKKIILLVVPSPAIIHQYKVLGPHEPGEGNGHKHSTAEEWEEFFLPYSKRCTLAYCFFRCACLTPLCHQYQLPNKNITSFIQVTVIKNKHHSLGGAHLIVFCGWVVCLLACMLVSEVERLTCPWAGAAQAFFGPFWKGHNQEAPTDCSFHIPRETDHSESPWSVQQQVLGVKSSRVRT